MQMPVWKRIVLLCIAAIVIVSGIVVACVIEREAGVYECSCCRKRFVSMMKDFVSELHTLTKRKLKCPKCGKVSYCKKRLSRTNQNKNNILFSVPKAIFRVGKRENSKTFFISLLAPWRVLGIDKCAALTRAAAKHTPRNGNKNNAENQTERRGGAEPSPLNRLGIGCRFSAVRFFLFIGFAVPFTS